MCNTEYCLAYLHTIELLCFKTLALEVYVFILNMFMHLVGKLDEVKSFVSNLNWKVEVTEAYFFVRYINGTWIYCAQRSKDNFKLLL